MRKRIILLVTIIYTGILFTACSDNSKNIETFSEKKVTSQPSQTSQITEELSKELYPAYINDGDKKWGFINDKGEFVIKPLYDQVSEFEGNGTAQVAEKEKWGRIDKTGSLVTEYKYSYIKSSSDGLAIATDDSGKSYLIDKNNKVLFSTEGIIGDFSSGMAYFSKQIQNQKYLWGYINTAGKVIVEPIYEQAQNFSNDKAIVEIPDGHYGIINKAGTLLKEVDCYLAYSLLEDVFVFSKLNGEHGNKYGYMKVDGEVLIDAIYSDAKGFEDGLAIVNAAEGYKRQYGVINKNGEFIIPARYSEITKVGDDLYAVPKFNEGYPDNFLKKALFDKTGKQLTEFKYFNIQKLANDMLSVTDDTHTYLIDHKGSMLNEVPKFEGVGSITKAGELYKVEVDGGLSYYSKEGNKVWSFDDTVNLGDIKVKSKIFRPDRCMLIKYPEINGMSDLIVQDKINRMLKDKFVGNSKASEKDGEMYKEDIEIGFTADKNSDLLIIRNTGYFYPIGAAHGMPSREDYHINLKNGNLFTINNLFKKESKYKEKLVGIVKGKISRINDEIGEQIYSDDIGNLEDAGFLIKGDSLQIYFHPYLIGPYAAGFPEFEIKYEEIMDMIDQEGELWKSFKRVPSSGVQMNSYEIYPDDKVKVEEALDNYENKLIEAINNNDFKLVEPWLYPDSKIYIAQKKLVADLNKKQIKEKLVSYSVEKIENSYYNIIKAYVTENIAIKYPQKDYETKVFNWVYTLKYDYESQRYRLTYIDKWDKIR